MSKTNQNLFRIVVLGSILAVLNFTVDAAVGEKVVPEDGNFKNGSAIQQQKSVSGKVTDLTNSPIPGVSVVVKGTNTGTITDGNGNYTLNNVSEGATLQFSFIGMQAQTITVSGKSTINVILKEDVQGIDEVVIVGYGTQKKVNLTGSVAILDTKGLQSRSITQTSQALQGKMAGVTITQNFGIPGNDAGTIRIRGIGTLGSKDPMVLIDGVEGGLNDINPRDIENISVLKDAASASIYGSRAANGVILINTKRGNKNEPMSVNYNGLFGAQVPTRLPDLVDGANYMVLKNEGERNNARPNLFPDSYIQEYKKNVGTEPYFNTDWVDASMKKKAMQYQHTLTIRGGTEKISALVSLSDLKQDALIENTNYERKTLRFNSDFKATNRLSFAMDGSLYQEKQIKPSVGDNSIFRMMAEIPAIYPAIWADGATGEGWNGDNPLGYIRSGGSNRNTYSRVQLNMRANYQFTDWLNAEVRYAPKYLSTYNTNMVKQYTFKRIDSSTGVRPAGLNSLSNSYSTTLENFYQSLIKINKKIGLNSFSSTLGFEMLDNRNDNFNASRQNFLLPQYEVLSGGDENYKNNNGGASEFSLVSYLGRVNYSFNDKYLLEANLRYDGSSRFASERRWGLFPSISAGWRISQESFMKNIQLLSNLKIRASLGKLGNQNIGNYPYLGVISINQPYYFGKTVVQGAAQTVLPNAVVTWETTADLNFGLDFGFFKNRLSGSLDLYKRNTYDILYTRDIPAIIGLSASEQNIAEVENKGWDLQLSWNDKVGKFEYGVDVVLSDVYNKVLNLNGKPQYGRNVIFENEEYQAFYGYECLGIYRSQDDLDKYPKLNTNVKIGDLIFKDQNGDKIIDATNDKKIIGSTIPRFNFGVTANLAYKGVDFSLFVQGVGKKDLYYNVTTPAYGGTFFTYQLGRLIPEDPTTYLTADWPQINGATTINEDNSFHVYNAAYIRCKNVVLGYTFPESLVKKSRLGGLRIYFTGQNLFTIDKLKIKTIDPEAPSSSTGQSYYPNTKTFALGIDLKF